MRNKDNFMFVDIKDLTKVLLLFEHKKDVIAVDCDEISSNYNKELMIFHKYFLDTVKRKQYL
jgi:hypothetical protein